MNSQDDNANPKNKDNQKSDIKSSIGELERQKKWLLGLTGLGMVLAGLLLPILLLLPVSLKLPQDLAAYLSDKQMTITKESSSTYGKETSTTTENPSKTATGVLIFSGSLFALLLFGLLSLYNQTRRRLDQLSDLQIALDPAQSPEAKRLILFKALDLKEVEPETLKILLNCPEKQQPAEASGAKLPEPETNALVTTGAQPSVSELPKPTAQPQKMSEAIANDDRA